MISGLSREKYETKFGLFQTKTGEAKFDLERLGSDLVSLAR